MSSIFSEVNTFVQGYKNRKIERVEGLEYNQYETIRTIEFYTDSKYLFGQTDELGRDKPFYNIVNYRLNTAEKATQFNLSRVTLLPDVTDGEESDPIRVRLLDKELHDWFKKTNYQASVHIQNHVRPKYGGLMVKKIEKDDDLKVETVDWRNLITDPVDPLRGKIVEIHYLTPDQLKDKSAVWKNTGEAMELCREKQKTAIGGVYKPTTKQIKVYEVYARFEEDDYQLTRSFMAGIDEGKNILLRKDKVDALPYKFLPWGKLSGRGLGRGVVEDGFEAQVWTNDTILKQRDILEHSAKVLYLTDDDTVENNSLIGMDTGDIIHVSEGKRFQQVNVVPSSFPQLSSLIGQWDSQYERVSATFDAVTGANTPARTPFRTIALQSQAGNSQYVQRANEFSNFQREIIYDWVLPHLVKKINKKHLLELDEDLQRITNEAFQNYKANQMVVEKLLNKERVTSSDYNLTKAQAASEIEGEDIYLEIPKGYFKDLRVSVDVVTDDSEVDRAAILEGLNNILISVAQNPQILTDPTLSKVYDKVIELAGINISSNELRDSARGQGANSAGLPQPAANASPQELLATAGQPASAGPGV